AKLMQEFGIDARQHSLGIAFDLGDALGADTRESLSRRNVRLEGDILCAARLDGRLRGQRVAALRLAGDGDARWQIGDERRGELEQAGRVALGELELDLCQRLLSAAGANLAHVETKRGPRSVGEGERLRAAAERGREQRAPAACVLGEELAPRRGG